MTRSEIFIWSQDFGSIWIIMKNVVPERRHVLRPRQAEWRNKIFYDYPDWDQESWDQLEIYVRSEWSAQAIQDQSWSQILVNIWLILKTKFVLTTQEKEPRMWTVHFGGNSQDREESACCSSSNPCSATDCRTTHAGTCHGLPRGDASRSSSR